MKRSKILLLGLLAVVLVCSSLTIAAPNDVLQLYTALDPNEAKVYITAFSNDTKINVEWVRMSAGELMTRLKAEAKNPQVSVTLGGPNIEYIAGTKAGLYQPYKPAGAGFITAAQRDPNWNWVGSSFGAIAFGSNTEIFAKKGWKYPETWDDLLKPEFKANVSLAYPYTSGTAFTTLATLCMLKGEDGAFEWWKKFDQNVHHYNTSGSSCVTQAGLGEIAIAISFTHDIMTKGVSKGYPIKMTVPKEGTGFEIGCLGIVKGAKQVKSARKFVDWILTARAQNLLKIWYRIPLNPEATIAAGAIKASDVKLVKFDAEWAGNNQARLIERWRKTIGK